MIDYCFEELEQYWYQDKKKVCFTEDRNAMQMILRPASCTFQKTRKQMYTSRQVLSIRDASPQGRQKVLGTEVRQHLKEGTPIH